MEWDRTLSSNILRSVRLEPEPLLIESASAYPEVPGLDEEDYAGTLPDLVEALRQEHPDAEDGVIEDALQEAIGQLLQNDEASQLEGITLEPNDWGLAPELGATEEPLPWAGADQTPLITPPPTRSADEVLAQAQETARGVVQGAEDEAARVLREADERAAEIERAAYEKGYQEGLTAGRDALDQQAADAMRQVATLVDEAQRLHDALLQQAEPEMVALALEVARKIVQAEVQTNPNVVTQVIAQAVERISGGPRVTIKVNPTELDRVKQHWAQAYGANFREKEWAIEGDGAVPVGGCLLVTRYGSLDARIDAQFDELQRAFGLLLGVEG